MTEMRRLFRGVINNRKWIVPLFIIAAIACDVPARLKPGGLFVCSGIINTKKDRVLEALDRAGFEVISSRTKNDWCAYVCKMK